METKSRIRQESINKVMTLFSTIKSYQGKNLNLTGFCRSISISPNTIRALVELNYIKRVDNGKYKVVVDRLEPIMARNVLQNITDYNIRTVKNKKERFVNDQKCDKRLFNYSNEELFAELSRRGYTGELIMKINF